MMKSRQALSFVLIWLLLAIAGTEKGGACPRPNGKAMRETYLDLPLLQKFPPNRICLDGKGRAFLTYSTAEKQGCLVVSLKDGKIIRALPSSRVGSPTDFNVSNDGKLLLLGYYNSHVLLVDANRAKPLLKRPCKIGALSPTGRLLATVRDLDRGESELVVESTHGKGVVFRDKGRQLSGQELRFVGETLLLSRHVGNVHVWDVAKRKKVWSLPREKVGGWFMRTISADIHPGAGIAVTGTFQGLVWIWTWPQGRLFDIIRPLGREPTFVAISSDGSILAAYTTDKVRFLGVRGLRSLQHRKLRDPMKPGTLAVFSKDSRHLIWLTRSNRIGFLTVPTIGDKDGKKP